MKYLGKAEETATAILKAFETPETLPAALAPIFIRSNANAPARAWSYANQLIIALHGHSDARGFQQWKEVGRSVKKGEKACHILIPLIRKIEEEGKEPRHVVYGFKSAPVFGLSQTEGDTLPDVDHETDQWLASLPLREVADAWGLSVSHYNGHQGSALGWYRPGTAIAMGVRNLSTWAHELVHAADDRRGKLKVARQELSNETVAEFGGAILLSMLGHQTDADLGGCFHYLQSYAEANNKKVLSVCMQFLKRTCEAVALIVETAETLRGAEMIEAEAIAA